MSSKEQQEYQVLARKYRPGKLSELKGHDVLIRTLTNAIDSDRIPHAFILTGIRGVGKTSTARIIARSLVCTGKDGSNDKPTTDPCGECENCVAIAEDRHVDILEMDAASRTGIDNIRELIESTNYHPVMARYKVYIIDEVHMLSKQAFNGLLKTLEEPPEHVKFIFATTEIRKIPVTILSRCMRFDLPRINADVMAEYLEEIAGKEGAKIDAAALSLIAYSSEGSARDAISLLDQAIVNSSMDKEEISVERLSQMLGLADNDKMLDLFSFVVTGKTKDAVLKLREIYNLGADPISVLQDLLELSHILTQAKIIPDFAESGHFIKANSDFITKHAEALSLPFLARLWQMLLKGISEAQLAPNTLMAAEMVLVRLAYASDLPTPGDLVREIKENPSKVEKKVEQKEKQAEPVPVAEINEESQSEAQKIESHTAILNLHNFSEVIELFKSKDENFLANWLEETNLIGFDGSGRKIEFRPSKDAPRDLAGKVGNLLSKWTGERWLVAISNDEGEKSIRQTKDEDFDRRKELAAKNENIVTILDSFPNSKITSMEEAEVIESNIEPDQLKTGESV